MSYLQPHSGILFATKQQLTQRGMSGIFIVPLTDSVDEINTHYTTAPVSHGIHTGGYIVKRIIDTIDDEELCLLKLKYGDIIFKI